MPMLAAFDVGLLRRTDINGPPWLGFVSGGVFVAAGAWVIAGPSRAVLSRALVLLVLTGLTAIGAWIAFAPGGRTCGGTASLGGSADLSGLACRVPFGVGALILGAWLCALVAGRPPRFARLRAWAAGARPRR
jgi:hypothetical protein